MQVPPFAKKKKKKEGISTSQKMHGQKNEKKKMCGHASTEELKISCD